MDCDVIILAGGRGTRLQGVLPPETPKPLAMVAGQPFLHWQLANLARAGGRRVTLSVGWQADRIREAITSEYLGMGVSYCYEASPLGTGGAIRATLQTVDSDDVVVLNGDTFLEVSFASLIAAHRHARVNLTVCTTLVADASRFGRLKFDGDRICAFEEKGRKGAGYVNAGVYVMRRDLLADCSCDAFSFETDFLGPRVRGLAPLAFTVSGVFVDIGVPADLLKAQTLFPRA